MKLSILICTIPSRYAMLGRLRDELNHQILPHAGDIEVRIHDGGATIGKKRNELLKAAKGEYVCFIDDDDWISPNYIDLLVKAMENRYYGTCQRCGYDNELLNILSLKELQVSEHDKDAYNCERCDGYMYVERNQPDCASLIGLITTDGKSPLIFEHSIKYNEYKTQPSPPIPVPYCSDEFNLQAVKDWRDANKITFINSNGQNEMVKYLRYPNHLNVIKSSIAKQFKFPEINHGEDTDWATQIHKSGLLKTEFYIPQVIYYYRYVTNKTSK